MSLGGALEQVPGCLLVTCVIWSVTLVQGFLLQVHPQSICGPHSDILTMTATVVGICSHIVFVCGESNSLECINPSALVREIICTHSVLLACKLAQPEP